MPYSAGEAQYALSYQFCPITLNGGVAGGVPGGAISLFSILQALSFSGLTSSSDVSFSAIAASFYPNPSTELISNQIGAYPFANMAIAANAIINQPLNISLTMTMPASLANGGYAGKQAMMTSLQNTLAQHTVNEGTFTVATPSFYYTNCILLHLTDVSGGETLQPQVSWKWDFVKPLVTLQDAAVAQNAMMTALSSGGVTDGTLSGTALVTGNPSTVTTGAQIPSSQAFTAAGYPASFGPLAGVGTPVGQ